MTENVTIENLDCVEGMSSLLDDGSVDLIIADPPYFKVVSNSWDYKWRTLDNYIEW